LYLTQFSGIVWRYTAIEQPPLSTELGLSYGGCFNPRLLFAMLYTSTSMQGAKAEFIKSAKLAERAPELLLPKMLHQIEVNLHKVVDLTDKRNRQFLKCSFKELIGDDWAPTQKIGIQLYNVCEAILSYSAADPKHKNLNLYIINPNSASVIDSIVIQTMSDWDSIKPVK
jgi:RES domain-containing protein